MLSSQLENLRDILTEIGIIIKRDGDRYLSCHCPYHSDSNPSFAIYDDGGFVCWGCGQRGYVTRLINDFADGAVASFDEFKKRKKREGKKKDSDDRFIVPPVGRTEYIDEKFFFTFPECPASWITSRNFDVEICVRDFELRYDPWEDRIVFPLRSIDYVEGLVGAVARKRDDKNYGPKYSNMLGFTPAKGGHLYGLTKGMTENYTGVILTEGPTDVLTMATFDYWNVVASCTANLSEEQASILGRYFDTFTLFYDYGDAGFNGNVVANERLTKYGRVYHMPHTKQEDGIDPGNYAKEEIDEMYANRKWFQL